MKEKTEKEKAEKEKAKSLAKKAEEDAEKKISRFGIVSKFGPNCILETWRLS